MVGLTALIMMILGAGLVAVAYGVMYIITLPIFKIKDKKWEKKYGTNEFSEGEES